MRPTRALPSAPPDPRQSAEAVRAHIHSGFLNAGRELVRIRPTMWRGEWGPYLAACGFDPDEVGVRRAQRLMQATRAVDAGEVPPDLSLRATLEAVAKKRAPKPAPAPKPTEYRPSIDRPGRCSTGPPWTLRYSGCWTRAWRVATGRLRTLPC